MTDLDTYRTKVLFLRAQANASPSAAEAASFLELAAAWQRLADEAEARDAKAKAAEG